MQDYSGAATHPPSPLYSLQECHSRCPSYSGVKGSFTQGFTKPQTYLSFLEQEASFSKGFVIHPEMKKKNPEGEFWCPSMAWDLPFQLIQGLWGVHCRALPSGPPLVPQPYLCTFSLCSWHLQYKPLRLWGCNKMLNTNNIYGVLQIMKFNVIFLEVIKTLSDSQ